MKEEDDQLIFYDYDEVDDEETKNIVFTWMRSTDDLSGSYILSLPDFSYAPQAVGATDE